MNPMKYILPAIFSLTVVASCGKSGGDGTPAAPTPALAAQDLSLPEGTGTGTSPNTTFNVVVKLTAASTQPVTVKYTTAESTAKAGSDYTALAEQTLTFAPGETEKTIAVAVVADDIREADEEFKLVLSAPSNATISKSVALIAIRNDDTKILITDNGYKAPTTYDGYTLAWQDEFDGTSLNTANWAHQDGDGCPNVCGWGNNELEWYTSRPENLFFQDGFMVIAALKETYSGKNYTSSKILSQNKKTVKFGRIDFRAKLPKGQGIWPAFWMLPNNPSAGWPVSGEIDIMENVGKDPKTTVGTLHYGPGPGSTQYSRSTTIGNDLGDEFHVYSLEWKEDEIKWFLDGTLFSTAKRSDLMLGGTAYPFNSDFFFIINLAVGGNWPGAPDATTVFPQYYVIDYVRLYQ